MKLFGKDFFKWLNFLMQIARLFESIFGGNPSAKEIEENYDKNNKA